MMTTLRKLFKKARLLTREGLLRWTKETECQFVAFVGHDMKLILICQDEGEAHQLGILDNGRDPLPTLNEFGEGNDLARFFEKLEPIETVNKLNDIEAASRLARVDEALNGLCKPQEDTDNESEGNADAG